MDNAQTKKDLNTYKLPHQFKPDSVVEDGPFGPWVEKTLKRSSDLSIDSLVPTESDLALISKLAFQTDDLGNNLADAILKDRKIAHQLEKGLAEGISQVDELSFYLLK